MTHHDLLTAEQQDSVVDAVRSAEKQTSGEIRIHIESTCKGDPLARAAEVFAKLGMHKTEQRNGVLIYLAYSSKTFSVIGDKGINDVVPEHFWEDTVSAMGAQFKKEKFAEGLIEGISMIGEKLKAYFPYMSDDINEQPDEISFGGGE